MYLILAYIFNEENSIKDVLINSKANYLDVSYYNF